MESPTLNTISEEEARRMEREGLCKVKEELIIDTYNINTVLSRFAKQKPNLISIDAEGVDDIIIDSLNFKLYYPEVLCIETLEFSNDFYQKKKNLLIEKVISKGYTVYADTNINTIFIRKNVVSWWFYQLTRRIASEKIIASAESRSLLLFVCAWWIAFEQIYIE